MNNPTGTHWATHWATQQATQSGEALHTPYTTRRAKALHQDEAVGTSISLGGQPSPAAGLAYKTCRACRTCLPVDEFHRCSANRDGLQAACKSCCKAYRKENVSGQRASSRKHYKKNPGKRIAATKAWRQRNAQANRFAKFRARIRSVFGITVEEWARMYDAQDRSCAICLARLEFDRSTTVDHCHATGMVRGLLCQQCNRGIGMLRDDATVLERAVEYIKNGGAS